MIRSQNAEGVKIRFADSGDIGQIRKLISECFSSWHAYYAKRGLKNHDIIIAELADKIIGFVEFKVVDIGIPIGHIYYMCVKREYRGRGIGKNLLTKCEEILFKRNVRAIIATTQEYNVPVKKLFRKFGYLIIDWKTAYKILKNLGANIEDEYDLMWAIYDYDDTVLLKVL